MPINLPGSRTQSPLNVPEHSNHLEHRLTVVEVQTDSHKGKISYLERAVQGLIYMTAALAVGRSGELVDKISSVLKLTR